MSIIPKKNTHDLTEEEVTFLRGTAVPPEVKTYLARQHENIGTKVSAYRKVAAAARAECDALEAVRDLDALHGELTQLGEAKEKLKRLERRADSLEATVSRKDGEIMRLTAGPAMAVHSGRD
jgi:hypothetical protein